jgi:hypothetical protein
MSAVEQEIKLIKKRLDNHEKEDSSAIQDMLKALTALTLTLEILSATKIGISVNSIRKAYKSTNTDISTQAGALVGQWKNVADSGRKSR